MLYSELSPVAQERARDWYRENCMDDNFWSECTVEDWKEKLAKKGFTDAEIRWSGFYCQGDGASFTAGIDAKGLLKLPKEFKKRLKEMNLVAGALERFEGRPVRDRDDRVRAPDRESTFEITSSKIERSAHARDVHANTIDASIEWDLTWRNGCNEFYSKLVDDIGSWIADQEIALTEEARDLSNEIFRDLEAAWDSENSDASVADALTANDYHFDEDGDRIPEHRKLAA